MIGYIATSNIEMILECCLFIAFIISMVIKLMFSSTCTNSVSELYKLFEQNS